MDDARIGRSLRVLRTRRGLRQVDVAVAAGVSQSLVSKVECGRIDNVRHGDLRRLFHAVDAGFDGQVVWRGAALDRLLDARHADVVAGSAAWLVRFEWDRHLEVSYSIYGERGSIDVLGVRAVARAALVVDAKSELGSLEATIRKLDEKVRLAKDRIVLERFGWRPVTVGRLIVLPDTDAARRAVARHAAVLDLAFPDRGVAVRRWLRDPVGPMSGIAFVARAGSATAGTPRVGVAAAQRVRRPRRAGGETG